MGIANDELNRLAMAIRTFVEEQVRPNVLDADQKGDVPWSWIERLGGSGLHLLGLPVEYGGRGATVLDCCVLGEELAAGDIGLASAIGQTWKLSRLLPLVPGEYGECLRAQFRSDD